MKSSFVAALVALASKNAAAHATFQALWCARLPASNSPVTNVGSSDFRCNVGGTKGVGANCPIKAGSFVVTEMHQQPGDRKCGSEAIGGAHYGPVQVYMSKVPDAKTADGSTGWFKIYQDSWSKKAGGGSGDDDNWGTKDMNTCCGKVGFKIPADIPSGDYLLRTEALALHTAGSSGGAQFYMTCFQVTVSGGGSASPPTVQIPGAYKASDPGILVNIHAALNTYVAPGPTVYSGGTTKSAGAACEACEKTCTAGSGPATSLAVAAPTGVAGGVGGGSNVATCAQYGQCGGDGWTGCTVCPSGQSCKGVSAPYYYQCG